MPPIDMKVTQTIRSAPYRVEISRKDRRRAEIAYLNIVSEPRTSNEIVEAIVNGGLCERTDIAKAFQLTLGYDFFLRGRMVDTTFLDRSRSPIVTWATQKGLDYLKELRLKEEASA